MQAQQSNTASGPGKTNTSFFASIRAAAAAQQQPVAHMPQQSPAPGELESLAIDVDNITSLPHDSERSEVVSHTPGAGVSPLENWKTSHAFLGSTAGERTLPALSTTQEKTVRIEDQHSARAALSRLINSANTGRAWRSPSPAGNPLLRRTLLDRPNFAGDAHLSHPSQIQSGDQTVVRDSFGTAGASVPDREPGPSLENLTVAQFRQQGLQRGQSARAGLAHDAKSLLAALKLYSELLALPEVLSEKHKHYASDLKSLAERSWALLERLLTLEDATDTERLFVPGGTSLVDVLTGCRSLLKTLAAGALEINFGSQAALPVLVPAEALERILINLVNNAAEATREHGTIRIKVGVETQPFTSDTQTGQQPLEVMVLTVDDSGCGMSKKQVYELTRERTTLSRQKRGIGLQIVQSLVAASGGTLELQSRIDVGTRVEMYWPLAGRAASGNDLREDGRASNSVSGVIDRMEMVADPPIAPGPGRIVSSGYLTDALTDPEKLSQDEQTRRWSNERGAAVSGAMEGWREAVRNLGFGNVSASSEPARSAKPAAPSTLSQGAIAC